MVPDSLPTPRVRPLSFCCVICFGREDIVHRLSLTFPGLVPCGYSPKRGRTSPGKRLPTRRSGGAVGGTGARVVRVADHEICTVPRPRVRAISRTLVTLRTAKLCRLGLQKTVQRLLDGLANHLSQMRLDLLLVDPSWRVLRQVHALSEALWSIGCRRRCADNGRGAASRRR